MEKKWPKEGCYQLTEKSEKWGFGGEVQAIHPDELLLPLAPLVVSLMGSLRVRRYMPSGEGEEEGKGNNVSQEEEYTLDPST